LRDPRLEARLGEQDRLYLAHAKKVKELNRAFHARKWQEVITAHKGLPAGLQDYKPLVLKSARARVLVGGADGTAALETCRKRFPGDPAVDMLALDYHYARRDYAAAVRALDVLQDWCGEDALLDAGRAFVLAQAGQLKAARAAAERAVAADPELKLGYVTGILVAVAEQDHAETLAWLKRAVEATGHDFGDLRQLPAYAEFIESPEFRKWLAWRATRRG
jgi:tetratricopeptide (TPR) repeat protein